MTVLVVDDEMLIRMVAAAFLDDAGFTVCEAVSADEAVAILAARPDVRAVVTDVEMPGAMNGCDLVRTVRAQWPGVAVIVTSGRTRPGADALPADVPFLTKPYQAAAVTRLIRQLATPRAAAAQSSALAIQGAIPPAAMD